MPATAQPKPDILRQLRDEGLPMQERVLTFDRELIDEETRTVQVVASTETPVERFYGKEILNHDRSAVMLDRFNDSAPVLVNHNPDDQVGVVEPGSGRLGDGRLRARIRFGRSKRADEIFQDIRDGIRPKFSVGYRIHKLVLQESAEDIDTYRADLWEPHELSSASVPADVNSKVGRSEADGWDKRNQVEINHPRIMPDDNVAVTEPQKQPTVDADAIAERARTEALTQARAENKAELERRDAITALGKTHDMAELAEEAIKAKRDVEWFKDEIIKKLRGGLDDKPLTPVDFSTQGELSKGEQRDLEGFRVNTLIQHALGMREVDGIAREMIQEGFREATAAGVPVKGLPVPQKALFAKRDVTVGTGGGATVMTELRGMIDFLRERLVLQRLGARFLTGLSNNIDWPVMGRGTPPTHKAEVEASDEYDWTSTVLPMRPHRLPVTTELSHQLVIQSTIDAENYTRETLANEIAIVMQETALKGSGAGNVPEGILNVGGVASIDLSGAAGGLDWANIISFESALAAANADTNAMAYLTHPNYRGTLKATAKDAGSGQFIWNQMRTDNGLGQGEMNGYPASVVTQLTGSGTTGEMIFGVWSALVIGQWGGLDLVVDNMSKAEQGLLRVIAWTFYDHVVERPEHFAASTNIGAA